MNGPAAAAATAASAPIQRVARPTGHLTRLADMYARGLGLRLIGALGDHDGFDGLVQGHPGHPYRLAFTRRRGLAVSTAPDPEQWLVFSLANRRDWEHASTRMLDAGFRAATACNPYWDRRGRTFVDLDGWRLVLQHAAWAR